jgi:esterase
MTYADMTGDIAHFFESRGLGAVDLMGHSMGGKAAMQLALSDPGLVRRLVVIDIAPVEYEHSHAALIKALQELDLHAVRNRADADRALRAAVPEIGIRQFLLQNLLLEHNRFRWRRRWRS